MIMKNIIIFLISIFFTHSTADAFVVQVSPKEVYPGDAFVIKVSNAKVSKIYPASFMKKIFYFSRCGKHCYIAVGAVDMKTNPGVYKVILRVGKKKKSIDLIIKPVSFPTIELTLPEDEVFRQAGQLSPKPEDPPGLGEWIRMYVLADEAERDRMLEVAKTLSRRSRKE